jgi:L-alanine-DL-glutamate epimerase-like enolase superfamily enzyme
VKYVTGEDIHSVLAAVESCSADLRGAKIGSYLPLFKTISEVQPDQHSARAGLEIAVMDTFCKLHKLPMCKFFGGCTARIETDVTVPIVPPETARELAKEAASQGFRCLKIKVGGDPEEDTARAIAVSEGAPGCAIRLDANQGFTPVAAVRFISELQSAGVRLDMIEQPVDREDIDGLRYVTKNTSIPVFADESAVTVSDACRLIRLDAVDGINVKLMKSGISGALDIIAMCRAAGKELMLGCMIETGIGLATAVHLACGTGVFSRLDLDAHLLAAEEPFTGGFSHSGPFLTADHESPGHGSLPV